MTEPKPSFSFRSLHQRSRLFRALERVGLIVVLIYVALGLWTGYRAWVQVRQLEVTVESRTLRTGMPALVHVITSGRTFVTVRLDLVQGAHSATLADLRVAPSHSRFYDPRTRQGTMAPSFTAEFLAQFQPGPAVVRATATGLPQWFRTPPPEVREIAVVVAPH